MAKPIKAIISRPRAVAAASGLPEESINWIPEIIMMMTVIKPASPRITGRISVIIFPIRLFALKLLVGESGKFIPGIEPPPFIMVIFGVQSNQLLLP